MSIYSFNATIISELYYNYDSYWGVYSFTSKDDIPHLEKSKSNDVMSSLISLTKQPEAILAGQVQKLHVGTTYAVRAEVKSHPKYGHQYVPLQVTMEKPSSKEESVIFLTSICTKRQAEKIIATYPDFIQRVINGDTLFDAGIESNKMNDIVLKVQENYLISDIMVLLLPLGVTFKMIQKIVGDVPNPVLLKEMLFNNPYLLTRIHGLGFKKVDDIALKVNPELKTSDKRLSAYIQYHFNEVANGDGHTLIPQSDLRIGISQNVPEADHHLNALLQDKDVITQVGSLIGFTANFKNESFIFHQVNELASHCNIQPTDGYDIKKTEEKLGITFTEEQARAIRSTTEADFVIISGSAGTGKSTVIQGVLDLFHDKKIGICALAAKAAQRVREITGFPAVTIHRLLGWKGQEFKYNKTNPLPYELVIIDEASMINAYLFKKIFEAINTEKTKVIIVFDHAQLPPIGSGNIATDLLSNKNIKINKFTKIHRQAEKSGILLDANKVRQGENPLREKEHAFTNGELQDMHYLFMTDPDKDKRKLDIQKNIISSFHRAVEKFGMDNVVVIVPRKQNAVNSTFEINKIIQDQLFDQYVPSVKVGKRRFAQGARVIQRVNDYERDVINGEIGYVTNVHEQDREFEVKFSEDKVVEYDYENAKELDLAYALTVHSYQGSQSDVVIVGIDFSHYILLDNCLLYTAITRASKQCKVISELNAFNYAVKQNKNRSRKTFLSRIIANDISAFEPEIKPEPVTEAPVSEGILESVSDNNNESSEGHDAKDAGGRDNIDSPPEETISQKELI